MKIGIMGCKAIPAMGGIETYVEQVATHLAARGHEVSVYCRRHHVDGEVTGEYKGVRRLYTKGFGGKFADAPSHTLTAALDAMRRGFDVLHVHGSAQGFVAPLLRLAPRMPVVVTIHALDWQGSKWDGLASRLMRMAAGIPVRHATELVGVANTLRDYYREKFGRDLRVIPAGVDIPRLVEPEAIHRWGLQGDDYILCVARLVPEKGCHYLVDAYLKTHTDKKLVIAGACPYEDHYTRKLLSHADDRIIFTGFVNGRALQELYSNASLYVQPSELEGLPLAVLEAMSYGRCVLASDIPGSVEALSGNGFTFSSRSTDDLARKMRELLADPDTMRTAGERARNHVSRARTWAKSADAHELLYEAVVAAAAGIVGAKPVTGVLPK